MNGSLVSVTQVGSYEAQSETGGKCIALELPELCLHPRSFITIISLRSCHIYLFFWVLVCCLVAKSYPNSFVILMDCSLQAPLSMGFSGQEYWSGLPCPSPGDLPNPGTERESPDK